MSKLSNSSKYRQRSSHPSRRHRHRSEELKKLESVLLNTCPDIRQVAGHGFLEEILGKPVHRWDRLLIGLDCDEIYPNIYVGNREAAENKEYLLRLGITHVLNTAGAQTSDRVKTGKRYYEETAIVYKELNLTDSAYVPIDHLFEPAAMFIQDGLDKNGKVFVHCLMGISRSGVIVTAYFMLKHGMSAEKALTTVRKYRDIRPNIGFLKQLVDLEKKLHKK